MEITVEQLTKAIDTVVGTRKYLPISESEGILVFERKGYVHIFIGVNSRFGSPRIENVANRILEYREEHTFKYHPELLELINGI